MKTWSLLALLALTACERPTPAAPSGQWTLFELDRAFRAGENVLVGADGVPGGLPAAAFIKAAGPVVPITPAFTQGAPSPYITTNVWANVPEVWIQPMYILVTHWDTTTGKWATLPGAKWIFTVGPESRFHSPFWQVFWAIVPAGTPADKYKSSRQLFDDKIELRPGPGRLVSLGPADTSIERVEDSRPGKLNHLVTPPPPAGGPPPAATPRPRLDYLEGNDVFALDFGENRFEWNEDRVVIEQPFFVLVAHKGEGQFAPSGAPNVGGTGPLFARRPAIAPRNRPTFGSLWRLHLVKLPTNKEAGVFLPRQFAALRPQVEDWVDGLDLPPVDWEPKPEDADAVNARALQVALNGKECFKDQASLATCRWLDSQQAIEENLPTSIVRTGITVACPFVGYDGKVVPLQ